MFKVPVTYTTYEGHTKEKELWFNLTRGELGKIHMRIPGGLVGFMERIRQDPNWNDMEYVFETIILTAYGKRTPSNKFLKSKEISEEFAASDAYSEVFLMFLNNEDNFVDRFLEGCLNTPISEIKKSVEDKPIIVEESEF